MNILLRKIRQSLIQSGNMKKYWFYAFGEIILVVIGILLALQINNWNEDRKARIVETGYLEGLENEFIANQKALDQFILLNEQLIRTTKEILSHTGKNFRTDITEEQLNALLNDLLRAYVEYEPSPGILEDLISSGNLNKLSNNALRKQLSDWKAQLATVRRQENTVLEYRSNIKNLLIEKGNTRTPINALLGIDKGTFPTENRSLLLDNRMENNLSFFAIASISLGENYYGSLDSLIGELLVTIRGQLQGYQ